MLLSATTINGGTDVVGAGIVSVMICAFTTPIVSAQQNKNDKICFMVYSSGWLVFGYLLMLFLQQKIVKKQ